MHRIFVVAIAVVLVIAGCGFPSSVTGQGNITLPDYDPTLQAPEADVAVVREGLREFSWELFAAQRQVGENLWLSPASVQAVLTMVLAGTGGTSHEQLKEVLHLAALPEDRLYPAVSVLWRELTDASDYQIDAVNWGVLRKDVPITQAYKDIVGRYLGANISEADYSDAESVVNQINSAVADNTNGMIKQILKPEDITPQLFLLLLNAVYFKGTWITQFDPDDTTEGDFTTWEGTISKVPMMSAQDVPLRRAYGRHWQASALPYEGGAEMLILLPDKGRFNAIADQLNPEFLDQVDQNLQDTSDDVVMPRFEYKTDRLDLKEAMQRLGATSVFKSSGDWGPLLGEEPELTKLGFLYQKAAIQVDEAGTEAAAVTVGGLAETSARLPFTVDRPFIAILRDADTRTPLFVGQFGAFDTKAP